MTGGISPSPGSSAPSAFHIRAGNNSANRELKSDTSPSFVSSSHPSAQIFLLPSSWKALFVINFPGTREPHRAVNSSAAEAAEQDNPWEAASGTPGLSLVSLVSLGVWTGLGCPERAEPEHTLTAGAHPASALAAPPSQGFCSIQVHFLLDFVKLNA